MLTVPATQCDIEQEMINEQKLTEVITEQRIRAWAAARRPWVIACAAFPIIVFLSAPFAYALSGVTDAVLVADLCIAVRMCIGLVLVEEEWKAWFYGILALAMPLVANAMVDAAGI